MIFVYLLTAAIARVETPENFRKARAIRVVGLVVRVGQKCRAELITSDVRENAAPLVAAILGQ